MRQGREGKLGMVKPTLETPDVIIEDASEAKDGDVAERKSSYVFVKAFKKADGSRYYYFTSVTVSKDGKEVVISNQEKRKNAIANLLTNGKLVWKHADDVSAASDVEQGLYSSQGNMSDPTTEGTDAPQTNVLSASKGGENSATVQEKTVKVAENQVASGVKGVHSDTYKRIIELADTYTKEVAEHENDYEWKDSYNDYSKRVEPLAETLTDEALKELYNELEERHDGLSMWIVDILEGRRVMSMRKRVDEQAESNKKALSKVKMELDAMTSLVDGFSNAVYFGTMPDSTRQDGVLNHYFAYPINYNGKRSYVFCRALHDNNTNRLYVHEVFIEDKIKKGNTLQTAASQPHGGISLYRDILANVLLSGRKPEVFTRPALEPDTNTDTSGVDSGQTNGVTTPAGNSPQTYDSKDTELSEPKQVKGVKVAENQVSSGVQAALTAAEQKTNTEPSEAQKEAGNYKKGHMRIDGYDVTIENPKGSVRRGTDAGGTYDTAVVVVKNNESTAKGSASELGQPTENGAALANFGAKVLNNSERAK